MKTSNEQKVSPLQEMARIAVDVLALPGRGFQESYCRREPAGIIHDSEWCRIKLIWDGWDYLVGNSIAIRYGRLHAPDDEAIMIWNDEICHCWHDIDGALHFLDGRSPAEAAKLFYSHPVLEPFFAEGFREKYRRQQPDWLAQMHLAVWEHYGSRLFELFDLRRPDLWEAYRTFLKEAYDIKGRYRSINPPLDLVS